MKKIIVLLSVLMLFSFGFGALQWVGESAVYATINGTGSWYDCSTTWASSDFNGFDFGSITSLAIGGECQSWETDGDYAKIGYMIDGGSPVYIDLPYLQQVSNNDKWQAYPGISIDISGLSSGAHSLALWFWVHDNDASVDQYDNNSSNNYVASFTIPTDGEVPVTLASFTAEALKGKVELAWVTESEAENSHFLVYRDGDVIARVEGNGTTTEQHNYCYTDAKVLPGVHSYAISDVTYGGVEDVHTSIEVKVEATLTEATFILNKAYPNPFNPLTTVDYVMARGCNLDLGVYNTHGEKVSDLYSGFQAAGSHSAIWNAEGFPSGIYFVRMIAGDMVQTMKVVLMK